MKKILIIEDDSAIAELERDYLTINNYQVDVVMDGKEGLEKALSKEYDLFIVDIMLPGMNGFDICRKIREQKETPLLLVSAKKDEIDKIRGLGLGADDYITKPFSPSELVARVSSHMARYERLVGNGEGKNPDIIQIRGLKIDTGTMRVWSNNDEIALTAKELELLIFFAKNPDRVFSKEEIFKEIWNLDSIGDVNTVTVHIKKLREKIELNPSKPQYIETIWGVGYRFKV